MKLVIPSLAGGGGERVCALLANTWVAEGKPITVVLVNPTGVNLGVLDPRVRVLSAQKRRVRHAAAWLWSVLNAGPSEPILAFGLDIGALVGVFRRAGLIRSRVVYREGSSPAHKNAALKYTVGIGGVDRVIVQSAVAAKALGRLGLGLHPKIVSFNPIPREYKNLPRADSPYLRMAVLGRLESVKGHDRVLRAFSRLLNREPLARLVIAGEGVRDADLRALAAELGISSQVSFRGYISTISELLSETDIVLSGSHYEGLPNALLEAIAAGCRVVMPKIPSLIELKERLEMPDCLVDDADYENDFARCVLQVRSQAELGWVHARSRLYALGSINRVATEYWSFCNESIITQF